MSDPLATYLSDHVAGARAAINLLDFLRDHHSGEPVGRFAADLLDDVESDRSVLEDLLDRLGRRRSATLKEGVAWIAEKLARLKLHRYAVEGLGTLLAIESIELGIGGKHALWRGLAVAAQRDTRLHGVDFDRLIERAQAQHERVEEMRLEVVRDVLQTDNS